MTRIPDLCARCAAAILDPESPRPVGMDAHVTGCARCGALLAAHRAAARLPRTAAPASPPASLADILARVRGRRRRRAALAGAAAAALVVGLSVSRSPAPAPAIEGDVFALADAVSAYVGTDVSEHDPALRAAVPLAAWFAAPGRHALDVTSSWPTLGRPGGDPP